MEDRHGNRDEATKYMARMDRAYSDREMAEWIREGTDKSDKARAIALVVFVLVLLVFGAISQGRSATSLIIAIAAFVIALLLAVLKRGS